jgi:hypothetical protein
MRYDLPWKNEIYDAAGMGRAGMKQGNAASPL